MTHVKPRYALISTSYSSSVSAVTERLKQYGATVFNTAQQGDITLSVEDGALTLQPYRERTFP